LNLFERRFQISPILATATIGGSSRKIVVGAGKGGYVIAFDRATGSQIWKTPVCVHQNDDLTSIQPDRRSPCFRESSVA